MLENSSRSVASFILEGLLVAIIIGFVASIAGFLLEHMERHAERRRGAKH